MGGCQDADEPTTLDAGQTELHPQSLRIAARGDLGLQPGHRTCPRSVREGGLGEDGDDGKRCERKDAERRA
jgi:hypothetical protein